MKKQKSYPASKKVTTKLKKKPVDYTLQEPKLPQLFNESLDAKMNERLKFCSVSLQTPAQVKATYEKIRKANNFVKLVITKDVIFGKHSIAEGTIVWGTYKTESRIAGNRPKGMPKDAVAISPEGFIVRIPSPRKLATRPMYEGEPAHENLLMRMDQVKPIK